MHLLRCLSYKRKIIKCYTSMNIILIPRRRRVLYAGSVLQYATSRDIRWMRMPDVGDGIYVCYHIINKCIASYLLYM